MEFPPFRAHSGEKTMIDPTKFNSGYRWKDYLNSFPDSKRREEWENGILEIRFFDCDLPFFLNDPLNILVIAENWCGDCREVVPILIKLTQLCPQLNLRIFPRDQNKDLMKFYSRDGKERIPTVVFFDENFREKGRWIEYSDEYPTWMEQWLKILKQGRTMAELDKNEKRDFKAAKKIMYRIKFRQTAVKDWIKILNPLPQ